MLDVAHSRDAVQFLSHVYRYVVDDWQHGPRDASLPDAGFEALLRSKSVERLRDWEVSQNREMGMGYDLEPASGVAHEIDLVARNAFVTGVVECKHRQDSVVGKNDVIVYFAKIVDYLCAHPFLLLKEVCPVFVTSLSYEQSALAACLGLGIHPVAPGLRPHPLLQHYSDMISRELGAGVRTSADLIDSYRDFSGRVSALGNDLDDMWVGSRFVHVSESQIGVVARHPLDGLAVAREILGLNSLCTELIRAFQAAKAQSA